MDLALAFGLVRDPETYSLLCVGTHHKTGTKWLRKAFRKISRKLEIPIFQQPSAKDAWAARITARPAIVFSGSALFPDVLRKDPACKVIRLIRDPRDVLLSGMRYHLVSEDPFEKFLYQPREALGGKTYQEHLNGLETLQERLLFEMDHKHKVTLQQMLRPDRSDAVNYTQWRYEDLIVDEACSLLREALAGFEIDAEAKDKAARYFRSVSLFSGKPIERINKSNHIASGAPRQWQSKLPRSVAEVYAEKFGEALIALGYETDQSWVETLSDSPEVARSA